MWKLVLLCGLLAGTSQSQLTGIQHQDFVQEGLSGALEQKTGVLENLELGQVQEGLGSLTQTLQAELNKIQKSSVWKGITNTVQGTKTFLGNVISDIGALGAELTGVQILDVKLEVNPKDNSMDLRFPIKANVNVALPLVGRLVNLEVSLDLLSSVTVEGLESENPTLVKGKCRSDPASFKLVLLDGKAPALNRLVDTVLSVKQKIVGFVIEKAVCPVINLLIDSQVGVIIKNILDWFQSLDQDPCLASLSVKVLLPLPDGIKV